jgi:hypothetical protein
MANVSPMTAMPTKLKALLTLIVLAMAASLVGGLRGNWVSWLSFALDGLLVLGIARGKEGARTFLMLLAGVGLLTGLFGAVLVTIVLTAAGPLEGDATPVIVGMVVGSVIALSQNGFALWCLSRQDVQQWMFQRSLGAMGDAA